MKRSEAGEPDDDSREEVSLSGILRLGSGIAVLVVLAGYSLIHALGTGEPAPRVIGGGTIARAAAVLKSQQPVYIGGKAFYPALPVEAQLVVHFACDQEDARIARIYDPPPSGRAIILRIDQSADQMHAIYEGTDPQFPSTTRVVTTPCMQALIDHGAFP
jgi:hypothetical protein